MPSRLYSIIPSVLAVIFLLGISALFSGCYTLKQGVTMLGYLNRAIPLETLGGEDRAFAGRVADIRRFATEELGLKESKNYTRYVELDREYLAAVVSASAKDSFGRHEWWFPVVGKVPYKGFFDVEDAKKERAKLEKKDLDVWVRGVDAFSTLGWFKDPLYSYMKNYSERELAELIIHELFHATVYLNNHSQFNEGLAEFVGTEGGRLYMERAATAAGEPAGSLDDGLSDNDNAGREDDGKADAAAYLAYIRGLIAELDAVYQNPNLSREEKLTRKAELISASQTRFENNYGQMFTTENYRGFSTLPVNNAYLELYRLYYEEDTWFKELYEKSGGNLRNYIAAAKTLKGKKDPRVELESALLQN